MTATSCKLAFGDRELTFDLGAASVDAIIRGEIPADMAVARRFGFIPRPLAGQFGDTAAACLKRFELSVYATADVQNVLALGLIGGGEAPSAAFEIVDTYVRGRPLAETAPVALVVLTALFVGDGVI
ncbi:MAG: gene transfer agent family protein [Rhizobiales bacterium]|nr:gene transfer agent family protein [Hyphomicrobiales bacterium]MBN8982976.1 gene transfer agent family protein [Hyphomicrobiales bacterium]